MRRYCTQCNLNVSVDTVVTQLCLGGNLHNLINDPLAQKESVSNGGLSHLFLSEPQSALRDGGEHTFREKPTNLINKSLTNENHTGSKLKLMVNGFEIVPGESEKALMYLTQSEHVKVDIQMYLSHYFVATAEILQKHELKITPNMLTDLKKSEDKFQKEMNKSNGTSDSAFNQTKTLVFTNDSNKGAPVVVSHCAHKFKFLSVNAKPDLTSLYRPMFLEVKRDSKVFELLHQAYERLMDQISFRNDVSSTIVAMTGSRAFSFVFKRVWGRTDTGVQVMNESIEIRNIDVNDISQLWQMLSIEGDLYPEVVHEQCPDYAMLSRFLRQITPLFAYCRIVAIGASSSVVYKITLPQLRFANVSHSETRVVVDLDSAQLAVKVVRNTQIFWSEALTLSAVSKGLSQLLITRDGKVIFPAREFYGLGYFHGSSSASVSAPVIFHPLWVAYFEAILTEQTALLNENQELKSMSCEGWWGRDLDTSLDRTGGIIIMRVGDLKPHDGGLKKFIKQNSKSVMDETSLWLRMYHQSHVVQRDVRVGNVMLFPGGEIGFCRVFGAKCPSFHVNSGFQVIDCSLAGFVAYNHSYPLISGLTRFAMMDIMYSITEPRQIDTDSGQYHCAGLGVRRAGFSEKTFFHTWTYADDYAMRMVMLLKIGVTIDQINSCDDLPAVKNISAETEMSNKLGEEAVAYQDAVRHPVNLKLIEEVVDSVVNADGTDAVDRVVGVASLTCNLYAAQQSVGTPQVPVGQPRRSYYGGVALTRKLSGQEVLEQLNAPSSSVPLSSSVLLSTSKSSRVEQLH